MIQFETDNNLYGIECFVCDPRCMKQIECFYRTLNVDIQSECAKVNK